MAGAQFAEQGSGDRNRRLNWSSRLFFFFTFGFAVYVFAIGDAWKWKKVFSGTLHT